MSRRPTPRNRAVVPTRRKQASRKKKGAGVLDHAIAALPVSEATLRKAASWSIIGVGGAVAIAVASWAGFFTLAGEALAEGMGRAGFRVAQVEVTGLKRMEAATVYAVALDQKSRAMPLVNLEQVRARLMEYGWVADARVSRRLPDTLVVDIVEREPAAVWQHGGQLMLIDGNGVALEPVNAEAMPDLPLVIGENANGQEAAYQRLLEAAPALKPLVKAATWVGNRRWDIVFDTGERLLLPEGEVESAEALGRFAKLDGTQRLLGRGYVRFDMRDEGRLVIRRPGHSAQNISATPTS